MLKIDIGCGGKKKDGFIGLDQYPMEGVDHVLDLGRTRWPFEDGSVDEAFTSHFMEHLKPEQRCFVMNELHRVLVPGGVCNLVVPHWSNSRAYGDPTHQWPPMGEFWFLYLDRRWRIHNAPHSDKKFWADGYDCNFEYTLELACDSTIGPLGDQARYYRDVVIDLKARLVRR